MRRYSPLQKIIIRGRDIKPVRSLFDAFRHGPIVLFFHGIEDAILDHEVQPHQISFPEFDQTITYLKSQMDFITLDDLYHEIASDRSLSHRHCLLTFDDGYKNNLEIVAPYLNSLSIPFTSFISTRHIDEALRHPTYLLRSSIFFTDLTELHLKYTDHTYDLSTKAKKRHAVRIIETLLKSVDLAAVGSILEDLGTLLTVDQAAEIDERFASDAPLTWDEVLKLRELGATIGSHGHDHAILHSKQSYEDITRQIVNSKQMLENKIGPCHYFAYPNGRLQDISTQAAYEVRNADYRLGFTTVPGEIRFDFNRFLLPRISGAGGVERMKFVLNTVGLGDTRRLLRTMKHRSANE